MWYFDPQRCDVKSWWSTLPARLHQQLTAHVGQPADPNERHVAVDFLLQELDRVPHPGLTGDSSRIEERPSDEDELRADRERLQHVGATANAAVHHYCHL